MRFIRDWERLGAEERAAFKHARDAFVEDLRGDGGFRKGLRVKRVRGTKDVWEMTWAGDGRATWQYGPERRDGDPHIIWRRIGTHSIFNEP